MKLENDNLRSRKYDKIWTETIRTFLEAVDTNNWNLRQTGINALGIYKEN